MKHINRIFEDFAEAFVGEVVTDREIASVEFLNRQALDFSLDSLKAVDGYLAHLHKNLPERFDGPWVVSAVRSGAYIGEVIRRNSSRQYFWVDFRDFINAYPHMVQLLGADMPLGVVALLALEDGSITIPLDRALRCIDDRRSIGHFDSIDAPTKKLLRFVGSLDDLHNVEYYARCEVQRECAST